MADSGRKRSNTLKGNEWRHQQTVLQTLRNLPNALGHTKIFGSDRERKHVFSTGRALLAIYASILSWVGAWELLTVGRAIRHNADIKGSEAAPTADLGRTLGYLFGGLAALALCNTLYTNAGFGGSYYPPSWDSNKWLTRFRIVFGLVAQYMCWVGFYDALDAHCWERSTIRDVAYLIFGLILLVATNSVYAMSYVYPETDEEAPDELSAESNFVREHVPFTIRCITSLLAQNLLWVACYNLLSTDIAPTETATSLNLFYLALGLLLMISSGSLKANSWLEFDEDEYDAEIPHTVTLWIRALTALAGQLIHNTGTWNLIDPGSPESTKDYVQFALYIAGGWAVLLCVGGLGANAAVYGAEEEAEEEGEGDTSKPMGGDGGHDDTAPLREVVSDNSQYEVDVVESKHLQGANGGPAVQSVGDFAMKQLHIDNGGDREASAC
eukprot:m.500868 g.500868  ORF g.500868 m.500868 type:complete len:440 (+) comp62362_c0_seq1:273-1592(+)